MLIRMRWQMSGGRHDGRPWPPGGIDFDVPRWEGEDLIRGGMADPADAESRKIAEGLAEQPTPGHPSKLDPRPATQIEAEAEGAEERAEAADEARQRSAQVRSAERESAEAYAEAGILGAPGSEVPDLYDGDEAQYPAAEGVRPASQVEAEAGVYEDRAENEAKASRDGRRASRKPGPAAKGKDEGDLDEPAPATGFVVGSADDPAGEQGSRAPEHVTAPVMVDAPSPDSPSPGSPKQEWVDYAVSQGADVHAAGGMTKADLMSRYGGRL